MKKIVVFADWYEPGYKAGGPIRSCVNFVKHMQEDYRVYVFTSDRDLGSSTPYDGIKRDQWNAGQSNVELYYCSPEQLNWGNISRQLRNISPDFVYLNSMFSARFTIFPLLICRLGKLKTSVVLAPRGMLRDSALQFKSFKKKIFLSLFRWTGLYRKIHFHASDDTEFRDVKKQFGSSARVTLIGNFPAAFSKSPAIIQKTPGELSLIFIGRVHPIKNLDYMLEILRKVGSRIRLKIVGSIEDRQFWEKCRVIIQELPDNITVEYAGEIPNAELPPVAMNHHIFVLPTRGENFGHAIFESLALGRPVLISDQTPWRHLAEAKAGWDLPLDRPDLFRESIEQAAGFGQEEYDQWCHASRIYVQEFVGKMNLKENYLKLFS